MITYRDSRGREITLDAPFDGKPAPWVVMYYSLDRVSDDHWTTSRLQGWTITYRAQTWREAAVWANANLGTSITLPQEAV